MKNENYRNRYQSLQARLINSYLDYYLLEAVEKNEKLLTPNGLFAIQHLVEVLKRDLCLSLCNICYDNPKGKSNTIESLQRYLENVYIISVDIPELKAPFFLGMKNSVKAARDTYIAHLDIHSSEEIIQISDLKSLLDLASQATNRLCFNSIDDEVKETNEILLAQYRIALTASIMSLIKPISTWKEDE